MHKLLAKLDKELRKYGEKEAELSAAEWKCVYEAIEARKDLLTSMAMTGEDVNGNYEEWGEETSGRYPHRVYDQYSGARRRDSMGRYSRGYSGHGSDPMLDALYDLLDDATTESERMVIQKRIDKMERRYS